MDKKYPKVGVGVMIMRDNKVLLGLRQGSHGDGEWGLPGGSVEFGESIFQAAKREAKEEVGVDVDDLELISISDEMKYIDTNGKHFVVLGVRAKSVIGEPRLMEPDKSVRWDWFDLNDLPEQIFEGTRLVLVNYNKGTIYTETKYKE